MLKNSKFANKEVVTSYGRVIFDEEGITSDLTAEQEQTYADIPGWEIIEDTFQDETEEAEEPVEEVDEEPEEELQEEPVEELQEEPEEDKSFYTRSELKAMTVKELEKLAEDESITLNGTVKAEKIQDILDAQ